MFLQEVHIEHHFLLSCLCLTIFLGLHSEVDEALLGKCIRIVCKVILAIWAWFLVDMLVPMQLLLAVLLAELYLVLDWILWVERAAHVNLLNALALFLRLREAAAEFSPAGLFLFVHILGAFYLQLHDNTADLDKNVATRFHYYWLLDYLERSILRIVVL